MKADEITVKNFLTQVWGAQPRSGYVFLAWKDGDKWREKAIDLDHFDYSYLPNDCKNLYFCPNIFEEPHRRKEYARSSVWLHADLDEVDPEEVDLAPTTAWETSPGRYQCLWRITKSLEPKYFHALNQRLTYLTGADKGGWSITKVLRVPGSVSLKYTKPFKVKELWSDQQYYQPKVVVKKVKSVQVTPGSVPLKSVQLPDMTAHSVLQKHRKSLTRRALRLIEATRADVGERSDRLWELECLCLQAGISPEETLILVRETVWNKFAGTRRELPQLWAEIQKAGEHLSSGNGHRKIEVRRRQLVDYSKFMSKPTPSKNWMVNGIWSEDAHGVIAGEPKTFKSIISTDLACSVASGQPFLGRFEVPKTGPVIIIQEENEVSMMKDRLEKIANSKKLLGSASMDGDKVMFQGPQELPIKLMNNEGFNLTEEDDMNWLAEQVEAYRPALLVLDPLYLMMPGIDENSAHQMTPILRNLLFLKNEYGVGTLIVHHYNKPRSDEDRHPGSRISGSGVFYRWFESAVYLEKGKEPGQVKMTTEHRGHAPSGAVFLEFDLGEMGELEYFVDVDIRKSESSALRKALREMISTAGRSGVPLADVATELDVSRDRAKRFAERMGYDVRKGTSDGRPGRPGLVVCEKR